MDEQALLQQLAERLDRLEAENVRLSAQLADVRPAAEDADEEPGDVPSLVSRRAWLARGAAVAVGAVAGGVALSSRPVAASNGETLTHGGTFIGGTSTTSITTNVPAPLVTDALHAALNITNSNGTRGAGVFGSGTSFGVVGLSSNGNGVLGYGFGDATHAATGVVGQIMDNTSAGSIGVFGDASGSSQIGVKATSAAGTALRAESSSGTGVIGYSETGTGVEGHSSNRWGGWFHSGLDDLLLGETTRTKPTLDAVQHDYGALVAENSGDSATSTLWFSVKAGTPGTWRRLAGPGTAGALTVLPVPVRVYDSRVGKLPAVGVKAPLVSGVDRAVDCTLASSGVPADAVAILVNLTVVGGAAAGYVGVRANGTGAPVPATSNVNFLAGQVVANSVTSACGAGAVIALRLGAGTCDAIIDVAGYYR